MADDAYDDWLSSDDDWLSSDTDSLTYSEALLEIGR